MASLQNEQYNISTKDKTTQTDDSEDSKNRRTQDAAMTKPTKNAQDAKPARRRKTIKRTKAPKALSSTHPDQEPHPGSDSDSDSDQNPDSTITALRSLEEKLKITFARMEENRNTIRHILEEVTPIAQRTANTPSILPPKENLNENLNIATITTAIPSSSLPLSNDTSSQSLPTESPTPTPRPPLADPNTTSKLCSNCKCTFSDDSFLEQQKLAKLVSGTITDAVCDICVWTILPTDPDFYDSEFYCLGITFRQVEIAISNLGLGPRESAISMYYNGLVEATDDYI
ncbi:MAG: hypothetical protein M1834_000076 [Cirrosporium novae-zelandiae]|nr:MAG: hypothetical protein M1834_000076 [Cirrosporium novae-zelandiae]